MVLQTCASDGGLKTFFCRLGLGISPAGIVADAISAMVAGASQLFENRSAGLDGSWYIKDVSTNGVWMDGTELIGGADTPLQRSRHVIKLGSASEGIEVVSCHPEAHCGDLHNNHLFQDRRQRASETSSLLPSP